MKGGLKFNWKGEQRASNSGVIPSRSTGAKLNCKAACMRSREGIRTDESLLMVEHHAGASISSSSFNSTIEAQLRQAKQVRRNTLNKTCSQKMQRSVSKEPLKEKKDSAGRGSSGHKSSPGTRQKRAAKSISPHPKSRQSKQEHRRGKASKTVRFRSSKPYRINKRADTFHNTPLAQSSKT